MSYTFLEVVVPEPRVDQVSASLLDLGAIGLEQRDPGTMIRAPSGQTLLVAWFDSRAGAEAALRQLPAEPGFEARTGEV